MRDKAERAFGSHPQAFPLLGEWVNPKSARPLAFRGAARNSLSEPDPGTAPVLGDEVNTGLFQSGPYCLMSVTRPRGVRFCPRYGVTVNARRVRKLSDGPIKQGPRRANLCTCHHIAPSDIVRLSP